MFSENPETNVNAGSDPAPELEAVPFRRPPNRRRFTMRYTIIDERGSLSFVGPCQGLKALVAACAQDVHRTAEDLLTAAGEYDSDLRDSVLNGLHVFDEHNLPGNYAARPQADGSTPGDGYIRVAMVQNREVTAEALHRLVAVLG